MLFRKPEVSTGRLILEQQGLDVLRSQHEPFAIVSAVGPTRTGKSSLLGRAFLRGPSENIFEIGDGVTSYTGGVWITTEPIIVEGADGEKIRTYLIGESYPLARQLARAHALVGLTILAPLHATDTEGFSGVGSLTSRTYEANLFGLTYLMSSAVIFNSMFPVDTSTVGSMNAHCNHVIQMLQGLQSGGVWTRRRLPHLLWSVQSFNVYNLRNSRLTPDELLSSLRNSSATKAAAATAAVLGSNAPSSWLLEVLHGR